MAAKTDKPASRIAAVNRRARFSYEIGQIFEAGIALTGTEVKSLREGRANLRDCYAILQGGEVLLRGLHITPYSHTSDRNLDPLRDRTLLINRAEIRKLVGKVNEKGMTLVALKIYFNDRGIAKVELGLGKGKKLHDKRDSIAERDARREMDRVMKRNR